MENDKGRLINSTGKLKDSLRSIAEETSQQHVLVFIAMWLVSYQAYHQAIKTKTYCREFNPGQLSVNWSLNWLIHEPSFLIFHGLLYMLA